METRRRGVARRSSRRRRRRSPRVKRLVHHYTFSFVRDSNRRRRRPSHAPFRASQHPPPPRLYGRHGRKVVRLGRRFHSHQSPHRVGHLRARWTRRPRVGWNRRRLWCVRLARRLHAHLARSLRDFVSKLRVRSRAAHAPKYPVSPSSRVFRSSAIKKSTAAARCRRFKSDNRRVCRPSSRETSSSSEEDADASASASASDFAARFRRLAFRRSESRDGRPRFRATTHATSSLRVPVRSRNASATRVVASLSFSAAASAASLAGRRRRVRPISAAASSYARSPSFASRSAARRASSIARSRAVSPIARRVKTRSLARISSTVRAAVSASSVATRRPRRAPRAREAFARRFGFARRGTRVSIRSP